VIEARRLAGRFDRVVEAALAREEIDLVVSWFWTRRLPAEWIASGRLGGVGVHPSLLPRHRGPNPYFWAIDSGDEETGVTVHRLTERYDDGAIFAQARIPVGERDSWQLARALDRPSLALLRDVVERLARGTAEEPRSQNEAEATWAPEPEGDALHVDFHGSNERVLRRMQALAPVPGASIDLEGLKLSVLRARAAEVFPKVLQPGEGAVAGDPPRLVIRTRTGAVAVERAVLDEPFGSRVPTGAVMEGPELGRLAEEYLRAVGRRDP
jgi:methionyl-tRNA formyltransferase